MWPSWKKYFAVNGYQRASTVSERGEYAVRGGVIDVFPPGAEEPVRLDLFGDTLESIRAFDPESQRSTRQLTEIDLLPVSEALLDPDSISRFRSGWVKAFGTPGDDLLYAAVSEGQRRQGLEHWLPLLYDHLDTLFDYLPPSALVALDHQAVEARDERLAVIADAWDARQETASAKGAARYRALPPDKLYLTADEFDVRLDERPWRRFSPFGHEGVTVVDLGARQGRGFAAERAQDSVNLFEAVANHAKDLAKAGKTRAVRLLVGRLVRAPGRHAGRSRAEEHPLRARLAGRALLRPEGAPARGAAGGGRFRHRQPGRPVGDRHPGRPPGAAPKAPPRPELPGRGRLALAGRPRGPHRPRHRPL